MKRIDWTPALFLFITPLVTIISVPLYIAYQGWHWSLFFIFAILWAITELSITAGYHRFLAHKSYKANPWLKAVYLLVGAGAFQASALKWCTDHRRHHLFVDTEKDPYNIQNGFWFAHMGWLLIKTENEYKDKFADDLEKDWLVYFQHKYYVPIALFMGFGLPALLGGYFGLPWGGVIFGGFLRIVCAHHCTFFINSLCHTWGKQPYSDAHSARDSFIMALFTFGEGYHNFHHEFQSDFRNGVRWYQWDPTKWFIQLSAMMGMSSKLRKVSSEAIIKAHVLQDAKRLADRGVEVKHLEELKTRVLQAQEDFRCLRQDWVQFKEEFKKTSNDKFLELKADLRARRLEFQRAHAQWKAYIKAMNATPVPVTVRSR